ncbi:MAG: uroporphyrinogen-III C-methyltransferase [Rhodospirillales bacterium]|nr:uroporphyrinogen-III C-methyltransferase [Rhodospirillales bacterium]
MSSRNGVPADRRPTAPRAPGTNPVHIVGAGPGDPDLLTVKARRVLEQAEVVVYDRLVSPAILALIPATAERLFVGKATHNHSKTQDEINALLIARAEEGRRVVRLKGGDPFVFGRGGEEALHLAQAGIVFEIVPGLSAATGCLAAAGIPLTHRGLAGVAHLASGHTLEDGRLAVDWAKLSDPQSTIVIYMGLATIDRIAAALMTGGLAASTPAAAIENGTLPAERRLRSTLGAISRDLRDQEFASPTLIVIGPVVALAEILSGETSAGAEDQMSRPRARAIER